MPRNDDLEALVKRHGATSYRNRADTQHPAYGFTLAGLENLLADVRKQDAELIQKLANKLSDFHDAGPIGYGWQSDELQALLAEARRANTP